ncbi:uncharacterized protein MYCFIDRAFT_169160 [Pseudocercospora fijiensis CIRAD86]|uniref:Uncharacterized protein n=1 Tax=Pseudocercospora fijiensis (strain CIRAD86) TaxID=383855 RepID=N1Q5P7_PSEFD|nr:uncharacterized protein MYCFIDRAFT_169160 [Pseudocercospora fijiensis CIRAD86]EME87310.1 hypothetical protein MYCFIDRAFT_169160 [Pseudocercospora fijiensis CIRAD86]
MLYYLQQQPEPRRKGRDLRAYSTYGFQLFCLTIHSMASQPLVHQIVHKHDPLLSMSTRDLVAWNGAIPQHSY